MGLRYFILRLWRRRFRKKGGKSAPRRPVFRRSHSDTSRSSSDDSQDAPVTSFASLCQQKKWSEISRMLLAGDSNVWLLAPSLYSFRGQSPLHVLVLHKAPIFLMDAVSIHVPTDLQDATGRTVLHLACEIQADGAVVQRFASIAPVTNTHGQTALHVACKQAWKNPTAQTVCVDVLVQAFPEACRMRDETGQTPWNLALLFLPQDASVLSVLQQHQPVAPPSEVPVPPLDGCTIADNEIEHNCDDEVSSLGSSGATTIVLDADQLERVMASLEAYEAKLDDMLRNEEEQEFREFQQEENECDQDSVGWFGDDHVKQPEYVARSHQYWETDRDNCLWDGGDLDCDDKTPKINPGRVLVEL